ncbi:MAG: hypothetical protein EOO68_40200, partial [Moraxellaceae bacterium]
MANYHYSLNYTLIVSGLLLMQIEQLYLGKLTHWEAKNQHTGIFKAAVDKAWVGTEGLLGDIQADRRFHG